MVKVLLIVCLKFEVGEMANMNLASPESMKSTQRHGAAPLTQSARPHCTGAVRRLRPLAMECARRSHSDSGGLEAVGPWPVGGGVRDILHDIRGAERQ